MKSSTSTRQRLERNNHKKEMASQWDYRRKQGCPRYFIEDPDWNEKDFDPLKLVGIAKADRTARLFCAFNYTKAPFTLGLMSWFAITCTLLFSLKSERHLGRKFCGTATLIVPSVFSLFYKDQPKITLKEVKKDFDPKLYSKNSLIPEKNYIVQEKKGCYRGQ